MTVHVLTRHLEACRATLQCPVRMALSELLPGHTVHIGGTCSWIDGAPVHLPESVYEWCRQWDHGHAVQPFAFDCDPNERPHQSIPGIYAKAGAA